MEWVTYSERSGRRWAKAETPIGTVVLGLRRSAGNFLTWQAIVRETGSRIATADSLDELKVEAEFHVGRLLAGAKDARHD